MCSSEKHLVMFILQSEGLLQEPADTVLLDSAAVHCVAKKPERTKSLMIAPTISVARQIHSPYNCATFHQITCSVVCSGCMMVSLATTTNHRELTLSP